MPEFVFPPSIQQSLNYTAPGLWIPSVAPDTIRLHAGYPAPELVPVNSLQQAAWNLLEEEWDAPLHYSGSPSASRLLELVQSRLSQRGIDTTGNRTLITAGSAQAINLIAQTLLQRDAVVIVERPTYMEALETLHNFTDVVLSVPTDPHGMQTDALEEILQTRKAQNLPLPTFVYTIPSFQNPTGATMTKERRQKLLALAVAYDFLIVEDDAYGELSFGQVPTPLKALDQHRRVLHLGSLSKVIAPGLRVGWVTGHPDLVAVFDRFKKDLTHPMTEAIAAHYLDQTDWEARLDELRRAYQKRRDILLNAVNRYLPSAKISTVPEGGYFLYVRLPEIDTRDLLERALAAGVSYVPGSYFHVLGHGGQDELRLSFSYVSHDNLIDGVRRLSTVADQHPRR